MSNESAPRSGGGDLSKSLELLWNPPPPSGRESRTGLDLDAIVAAAIMLADREGLAALSMRRVAAELGVGAMSLYRYVPGKSELLDLMLDRVEGGDDDLSAVFDGLDWRGVLEQLGRGLWELHWQHPWLVGVNQSRPLLGPRGFASLEVLLSHLQDLDVPDQRKMSIIMAIQHYVTGTVRTYLLQRLAEEESGVSDEEFWAAQYPLLEAALGSGAYPTLAAMDHDTFDLQPLPTFELGLTALVAGLAAQVEADPDLRRTPAPDDCCDPPADDST